MNGDKQTDAPTPDWFLPAIEATGSVGECLDAVLEELAVRSKFIKAIRNRLVSEAAPQDNVTALGQRVRTLENTLKVRLGILNPDREASWFRISPTQTSGPFATTLLSESVFFPYESSQWSSVKDRLLRAWRGSQPFDQGSSEVRQCLWSMLLALNSEYHELARLDSAFSNLRLDQLPDGLPEALDSRSLRAFLLNVRNEFLGLRRRLDASYEALLKASERFWAVQEKNAAEARTEFRNQQADDVREHFKKRRHGQRETAARRGDRAQSESLKFMGFDFHPGEKALRKRYLEMAKTLHPDRVGGDEAAFKMLTIAYSTLTPKAAKF